MASALSGDPAVTVQHFTDWKTVLDPEFRRNEFPGLATPEPAIVRWIEVDEREQPTGNVRENPAHRPGPEWFGGPKATTPAAKLMGMRRVGWIDDATLRRQLLDCEVLVPLGGDGEPVRSRTRDDRVVIPAYSATVTIPAGIHRWRRIRPRDLLRPGSGETRLDLDPGHALSMAVDFAEEISGIEPEPGRYADEVAPEVSPHVTELATRLGAEYELGGELVVKRLTAVAGWARKNGYELSADECERYARAYARWVRNLRLRHDGRPVEWPADLAGNGLVNHYDDSGRPAPRPWTMGKFQDTGTPSGLFAWHRVVGAYVGFAVGECLALGNGDVLGPMTRQMLRHTETVLRGLPFMNATGDLPPGFPPAPKPDSWLAVALGAGPEAPPNPLTAVLAATMTAGLELESTGLPYQLTVARALTGADGETATAIELLVRILRKVLVNGEPPWPFHAVLGELRKSGQAPFDEIAAIVLALRDGRDIPDAEQIETLGDPASPLAVAGRAVFAAAKRHHDPFAAIQVAGLQSADPPLTAALTGALIGARVGVFGLPADLVGALTPLGLLDNLANDVYLYFNLYGVARSRSLQETWPQRYPKD
ncbi:ADP-ribosylglycohydrolase family protein [Amycolatopsis thermalba]|uniref:ADP-ribosylglycohydrolase family protein n=1 Tax=Amycolatopsis thermalba TaxID=944492 RepID=UPI000E24B73E|nr:ADP-ribosylglycohydrolase family protein [Amycolatopsis thermalba]